MRKPPPKLNNVAQASGISEHLRPTRRKSIPMAEFMDWEFAADENLLGPIIASGSTGMIVAPRGLGKSLLVMHIAYAVAGGKRLHPWGSGSGSVVVYLDGEMKKKEFHDRLQQIMNRDTKHGSKALVAGNLHLIGRDAFEHVIGFIDNEEDQTFIESMLPESCRLLIVDNLSAWTSSAREDGTAFAPIKRWLSRLRTKGIAVLLVHHTGKTGSSQRGTSIHEDMLDYSILLRENKANKPKNGTSFLLEHTKLRGLHPDLPKVCRYTFTTDALTNVMDHHYEDVKGEHISEANAAIIELLKEGKSGKEVAQALGITASKVSRAKSEIDKELQAAIEAAQVVRAAKTKARGGNHD